MTTFADMVFGLGGVPLMAGVPFCKDSKYYFVDARNGSDGNDGLSPDAPLATIIAAEDKCVANRHDTIFIIGTGTAIAMTAALTWDKDYTHLIGICAPTQIAQRARISHEDATYTGLSPLFNVTATGCIFKNFYCFQGVADATSLINWQVTGGRNYFENVHFAGGGHDTMAIDNCASLFLNGAEECTFVNCVLGVDTIALGNGGNVLRFDGSAHRNIFRNCILQTLIDNGGARLVELVDASACDRITWFDNCTFISNSVNKGTTMASAFEIPSGHTTTASIFLKDCTGMGFTDWDDDDRGLIYMNMGTITAGGNSGVAQVSAAT
jgi:hypothetical protein